MRGDTGLKVDEARLEEFRQTLRRKSRGRTLTWNFVRQLTIWAVLFFGVFPILDGRLPARGDFTGRGAIIRGIVALVLTLLLTGMGYRQLRDTLRTDLAEHRRLLQRDWDQWTGSRWWTRALRWGLLMTAGVGLPVGLLMALTMPKVELPAESRPLMLLLFVGLTALWAIPMAFGLRWLILRQYRSLMDRGGAQ